MLQETTKRNIVRHPAKLSNILDFMCISFLLSLLLCSLIYFRDNVLWSVFDLFKISKITSNFSTFLKSAKWLLSKQSSKKKSSMFCLKHKKVDSKYNRGKNLKQYCKWKNYNYSEWELESNSNWNSINSGIFIFFILYLHSSK